ncbi:A1 family peptidase [Shewanella sp. AS16]|uniref:pepsin-like aspartic protease n=1 Tax=Shewanella sp. AS16 TaxID=2907625 RepID=UPI001F46C15F|nr:pepsin-like aspartic protease [Shewanella sp. AS16]MCE9685482.1 A1 family peptidase [Shewanella sp. AS16]
MPDKQTLILPLTNVHAKGDYTVRLRLGSRRDSVNLILDTGSSTLVVREGPYCPDKDASLRATSLAQEINYGIGGWDGPVVHTRVQAGTDNSSLVLESTPLALACAGQEHTFGDADGILGLAYRHLNKSYDLTACLRANGVEPPLSYPWPFEPKPPKVASSSQLATKTKVLAAEPKAMAPKPNAAQEQMSLAQLDCNDLSAFKHFLWQQHEQDIDPYFSALAQQGLCANKFAFYSRRSSIHVAHAGATQAELEADPLNQGYLVLGGGEEQSRFYQGEFQTLAVEHDIYYNVSLVALQVADGPRITAAPLQPEYRANYFSNAIIDTGASGIALTDALYQAMSEALCRHSADFAQLLAPFKALSAQETGIDAANLRLADWPDIHFIFAAAPTGQSVQPQAQAGEVILSCRPETYWQLNSPAPGRACFKIISQLPNWPNQSILGLPLLNNYFTLFDRSIAPNGVIGFAPLRTEAC